MKVYRAIEFSKLIWMISDDASLIWNEAHVSHENGNTHSSNWWMNDLLKASRHNIISDVIYNGRDRFFDRSLEFNAMQGGRFNPSKSFGVLYTSSNPLMACLEVLYHQFTSAFPLYKKMNRNSNQFTSSFNIKVPQHLQIMIECFEIEIDDNYCSREVCSDIDTLKEDCKKLGFERYIGDSFSRDFIFGNDYEISRILGCYLHSYNDPSYKVPSARVDFDIQDELEIRNYLIPEKQYQSDKVDLTGRFIEYKATIDLEANDNNLHEVEVEISGMKRHILKFNLQPIPYKNKPREQFLRYEPNLNDGNDRRRFFRGVELQKFI
jgi:hypothetical protein